MSCLPKLTRKLAQQHRRKLHVSALVTSQLRSLGIHQGGSDMSRSSAPGKELRVRKAPRGRVWKAAGPAAASWAGWWWFLCG